MPDQLQVGGSLTAVWNIDYGQLSARMSKVGRAAKATLDADSYRAEWCWLLSAQHRFNGQPEWLVKGGVPDKVRQAADILTRIRIIQTRIERGDALGAARALAALDEKLHQDVFTRSRDKLGE